MKKTITALLLIISIGATAQTYLGAGINNGLSAEIGTVKNGFDIKAKFDFSLSNTPVGDTRQRYSLSLGKRLTIWAPENEDDNENFNWAFIPSIGWCYGYEVVDVNNKIGYKKEEYNKLYLNFEVQKSITWMHRLKLVAGASYSNGLLPYIGFKGFLNKKH
jgi:hypothetical protein